MVQSWSSSLSASAYPPTPHLPPLPLGSAPLGEGLMWLQYLRLMDKDPAR